VDDALLKAIQYVYNEREEYIQAQSESKLNDAISIITDLIMEYAKD